MFFWPASVFHGVVKNKDMLGFVPQTNIQAAVINQDLSDFMLCRLANPIFYAYFLHLIFNALFKPLS